MKKLLILIIVLACMGCSMNSITEPEECEGCNHVGKSCFWGQEWNNCTCQCEWVLFGG